MKLFDVSTGYDHACGSAFKQKPGDRLSDSARSAHDQGGLAHKIRFFKVDAPVRLLRIVFKTFSATGSEENNPSVR